MNVICTSGCNNGSVSVQTAPSAKLTFTFDSVTGGTATSRSTSKTINEKCYIQPGKSNCSVTTSWTTENATHAVLTFPDLNRDYPDQDLYNDPAFRTEGLTGSRTMRLARQPATPHPGYNIGGHRQTLILNNSTDGQHTTYSITLTAVCADGVWDKVNGICPAKTTTTPTEPPTNTSVTTASTCSVSFLKTDILDTETLQATVQSTGASSVEYSVDGSAYFPFATINGRQNFSGFGSVGTTAKQFVIGFRGIKSKDSALKFDCSPRQVTVTLRPSTR